MCLNKLCVRITKLQSLTTCVRTIVDKDTVKGIFFLERPFNKKKARNRFSTSYGNMEYKKSMESSTEQYHRFQRIHLDFLIDDPTAEREQLIEK